MFQKKGENPISRLPDFKIIIPCSITMKKALVTILEGLDMNCNLPILDNAYVVHRNGELGYGEGIEGFTQCSFPEMTFTELGLYKVVPMQVTKAEIESLIGHQIEIIEEKA